MAEGEMVPDESEADKGTEGGTVSNEMSTAPALVTKDMAAAAGFNVKSPILNAVLQSLTQLSSEEAKKGSSQEKRCPVCDACITADCNAINHILGKRHKKKMWSLRIVQSLNRACKIRTLVSSTKGEFRCPLCKVTVNSPIQLVSHMRSKRHTKVNTKSGIVISANPIGDLSCPTVTYFCQHCQIHLNSHKKMLKHKNSLNHQIRAERIKRVKDALRTGW